ncbi:MAG: glycoside hydrolase family 127 protein [Streptosporangiaceae bacterium]|nr:glycoside hydrolase family 127 protein [Streptosporangiaceae bacterium]
MLVRENLFLNLGACPLHTPDESAETPPVLVSPGGGSGGPVIPTSSAFGAHRPLALGDARLTAGLLHDWQQRNATASMPLALRQLEVAGNLDNLRLAIQAGTVAGAMRGGAATAGAAAAGAATAGAVPVDVTTAGAVPGGAATVGAVPAGAATADGTPADGDGHRPRELGPVDPLPGLGYRGPVFMDSDIYKTVEAIGWELARGPQPALTEFTAAVIELLEQAQQADGYLNSYVQASGEPRYARLAWSHELYCAGHLIQAAIAMRRAAGDARLLDIATRLAGNLVSEFAGKETGKERGLDGHPIVETALTELYRATGTVSYLDLARQFVDQRGHGLAGDSGMGRRYLQDHLPVRESDTEVGHVVRALYLEAGVVDVAVETHDDELLQSSVRRWDDMLATKTYLTGGNGSRHVDEGFGDRFELPPDRAYNETCAAIASFQWSWRLLLATGDAKYADHMERVLFNGFAAAISAEGDRFFYVNPLQRREDHFEKDDPGRRRVWFSCACCPPNIMRLLASLDHYLATVTDGTLHVHQYASSRLTGADLDIDVTTDYPWSGQVTLRVLAAPAAARALALRIPAWSTGTNFKINSSAERSVLPQRGYLRLRRQWRPGDVVTLHLDLTPRWTYPDRRADAMRGCAAVERGPLVYCFEQADQLVPLHDMAVRPGTKLSEREATLDGIGRTIQLSAVGRYLPPAPRTPVPRVPAVAIPYFQWDNRGPGAMRVWIPGS